MTPEQARADITDILATRAQFWQRIWAMASAGHKPPGVDGPPVISQHQRAMLATSLGERQGKHIQEQMREGRAVRERKKSWLVRHS